MFLNLVQEIPEGRKVRIVEIGSATGGLSAAVLAALTTLAERVEYTYTSASQELVAHARNTYGAQYHLASFTMLDIEQDIVPQVLALLSFVPTSRAPSLIAAGDVTHVGLFGRK